MEVSMSDEEISLSDGERLSPRGATADDECDPAALLVRSDSSTATLRHFNSPNSQRYRERGAEEGDEEEEEDDQKRKAFEAKGK